MSKLSQLCSYLERADATALSFAVGSPAVVKSTTRDLPVTVTPLTARNIAKFFEGTAVSGLLAGGDKEKHVDLEVDGKAYACVVTKQGTHVSVLVRPREAASSISAKAANEPRRSASSQRSEKRPPRSAPASARPRQAELERDFGRTSPPREDPPTSRLPSPAIDLPSTGGPETSLPSGHVAPRTPTPVPGSVEPAEEAKTAPSPAAAPAPNIDLSTAAPAQPMAPPVAPDAGLGAKLAPARLQASGTPRLERMLRKMVEIDASDLHMSADSRPIVRLHGKMQPLEGAPHLSADELSSLLLEIVDDNAYRDFVENADADFAYAIKGCARFRANYFADRKGMGAVFRQIPVEILEPEVIGLPSKVLDLCWLSKGLVLVTGPTGSGKSTTLASMIDFINRNREDHIITIEDPIEFVHENKKCLVNQREVGRHTRSFKSALRAALREDPDVILVGELRDLETIAIAVETAETGHLVFGTLHTTTAPSTVDRLIDQFPGDQQAQIRTMLGESMRGVIGQTLLRRKSGGRVAAYEVLLHTSAVGNLIREGKT
ncbi:MAG: PilT/PilU family type 4a pilus ATPase, partial [Myxococcota bacterium]